MHQGFCTESAFIALGVPLPASVVERLKGKVPDSDVSYS